MKFGACALFLLAQSALSQSGGTIEGTVTDKTTHAGVAGVSVTLWTQKGVRYSANTDTSGTFRIVGVEPGEYNSRFENPGFVQVELPMFGQPRLRVGMSAAVRQDVEIAAMGSLRGRVLGPDGQPAPKVTVELGFESADTDAEGRFELKDLRPGAYFLKAGPKAEPARTGAAQIVPTWYPSTTNMAEAEQIVVRPGADLAGYEIRLRTSNVYHVRGLVLDELGKPLPNATVRLLAARTEMHLLAGRSIMGGPNVESYMNLPGKTQEASVVSRQDGTFEFVAVRPGEWNLSAQSDTRRDSNNNEMYLLASGWVAMPVSDNDIDNIELRLQPSFSLEVTADWGGQQAPANGRPSLMVMPAEDGLLAMGGRPAPGGGIVFAHMQPGRYRIMPTPGAPSGFYAAAIMIGGQNVLGQEVELSGATPAITVVYRPNPGRVRGTVEQGEGATVLLWPDDAEVPPVVRSTQAGAHGEFEFAGVAPGSYSLVAFDHIPAGGGPAGFLRSAIAGGARVSLQEGGSESVEVTVTHWPE
jgi:protocatechuate 3,4-dioxygenase beta subunit